jgi:stage V sporulation protein D (sporulation-specific penicillin-binding protein)
MGDVPMVRNKTYHRRKICVILFAVLLCAAVLLGRLVYLMLFRGNYYSKLATDLQQRERQIKAARGKILDRNGVVLASNKSVCTISVIHNQIEDPEGVIAMLVQELGLSEETVRKRVEKYSSIEKIKSNVDKETGNRILAYGYAGVKVDEDYKRDYPYDTLASKVLGFTGGDNQGIIGLESVYDSYLQGTNGMILTTTDARGVEVDNIGEERVEPVAGYNLCTSLDVNIQMFAEQAAEKAYIQKEADSVSILVMNPSNGEVLAMVDYPEFNLNEPFTLIEEYAEYEGTDEEQDYCNQMWRNHCINDTYEPGSTFKIITATAALEESVVTLEDSFYCPGYIVVEDRRIRCHKTTGHGAESFVEGIENSCNPVFINVGLRIGADRFYDYFEKLGLLGKTGIDLPGEAATIMHKRENIGLVELATISFGQSFQITPIQLATTVSSIINGGNRVTPHLGVRAEDDDGNVIEEFSYETTEGICSSETSEKMRYLLEKVVSEGGGSKAYIEGYEIGGKTATSQTLPRSANRYIASFLGFAPADDPKVLVLIIIRNPTGTYYGGTIAAPVAKEIFENILPYLELE